MKMFPLLITLASLAQAGTTLAANNTVQELLQDYAAQGAATADAAAGQKLWQTQFGQRSCTSCHTDALTVTGQHAKTNKLIEPMATSVNPERLTDPAKVEKWFKRNCKWTLGRECTAQEKANFLVFINN